MNRLALIAISLALLVAAPASAADLDGPVYRERRTTVIEQPPVVERRIIEHHHYYEPAPRTAYIEEEYVPRVYGYRARPFHAGWHWRHRHFRGPHYWHRHHRHHRW